MEPGGVDSGGFDFGALMQSAAAMQQQMAEAQASLADERAAGSAGGGLVKAEVDGTGRLISVTIDPSVVDPEDVDTLADLFVAAVRDAARAAEALAQEKMGAAASGMLGGLPGGLSGGLPAGLSIPGLNFPGLDAPGLEG